MSGALNGTIYLQLQYLGLGENNTKKLDTDMLVFWSSLQFLNLGYTRLFNLPISYPEHAYEIARWKYIILQREFRWKSNTLRQSSGKSNE